jgi:hypothetical protein
MSVTPAAIEVSLSDRRDGDDAEGSGRACALLVHFGRLRLAPAGTSGSLRPVIATADGSRCDGMM